MMAAFQHGDEEANDISPNSSSWEGGGASSLSGIGVGAFGLLSSTDRFCNKPADKIIETQDTISLFFLFFFFSF